MEESHADYWANIAVDMLVTKQLNTFPNTDPRTFEYDRYKRERGNQMYQGIYRVDTKGNLSADGPVQVISLSGPLMQKDYCGAPGMITMQQALRAANADPGVKSILLYNDSPGGSVAGTGNLAAEVKNSPKPVVSFVNKVMASANYWIGSSAREIIADNEVGGYNTLIGSIGTMAVFSSPAEGADAKEKLVKVYATKSSRKGKYMDDIMSGDHARLVAELDAVNEHFHSAVKVNRAGKLKLEEENVLEGDVYNVKDALKWGLIDKTGSFEYAVKRSLQLANSIGL